MRSVANNRSFINFPLELLPSVFVLFTSMTDHQEKRKLLRMFRGTTIGRCLDGLSRPQIFDQYGRLFDLPVLTSSGAVQDALRNRDGEKISRLTMSYLERENNPESFSRLWGKVLNSSEGAIRFEKIDNLFTQPSKFCIHPIDRGDDFYLAHVGPLTDRQKQLGISSKQIYDATELILREQSRIEKLELHLHKYYGKGFSRYCRKSWPMDFVRVAIKHILKSERTREARKKIDELAEEIFPFRQSSIYKVGQDGLTVNEANRRVFSNERLNSCNGHWSDFCTSVDVYCNSPDTLESAAREIEAIVMTLNRFKRKKWQMKKSSILKPVRLDDEAIACYGRYEFLMACRIYMDEGPNVSESLYRTYLC